MKTNIRERKMGLRLARGAFGILVLLTASALVTALAGSSAQAQLPSAASKVAAPMTVTPTPVTGGRIAFDRLISNTINIYTMDADGGNVTQVTTGTTGTSFLEPAWSRDGSRIAFSTYRDGAFGIYVMNADGSNQHRISDNGVDEWPAWSPDDTKIAFDSNNHNTTTPNIYVMSSSGISLTRLTTDTAGNMSPTWSPDGTKIAWYNYSSPFRIHVMNSDGTNQHAITNPPSGSTDIYPEWSPDGTRIAFQRNVGNYSVIHTMNADGSDITPVSNPSVSPGDLNPTWSPDGQKIAFSRYDSNGVPPNHQIYVVDIDGSHEHSISSGPGDLYPDWQRLSTKVLVQNAQGTPVAGAEVYTNTQGAGYPSTLLGATDMSGTISLPNPELNEYLIARSLVYTGTTAKGSHDGWAYHVWSTNITQQSSGRQSAYKIQDPSLATHTLVVTTTSPLIGFNIVASVEYNATPGSLSTIATGLSGKKRPDQSYQAGGSDFLLDVSDGQMFFEKVTVYEDKQNWDNADYQFFASYPRADANLSSDGRSALTGTCCHIHVQGSGDFGTAWDHTSAYSTLVHEFTHYAIGASDEYYYQYDGDTSDCSINRPSVPFDSRASIMADNRDASEYCTQDNHNPFTNQGLINGVSVWETLQRNWNDSQNRWTMLSPTDRGFVDPGPWFYISYEAQSAEPTIVPVAAPSCAPIPITITLNGSPAASANVTLTHHGYSINEGVTNTSGKVLVYGAEAGNDTVEARGSGLPGFLYTGSASISGCSAITIPLSIFLVNTDQSNTQWPAYWLTATTSFSQNQVHALLHFAADPPSQPSLYASQGGIARQQITLTYDPAGHNYTGDYTFDPSRSLDFQFEVGLSDSQGVELFPYSFVAAQFHSSGPEASVKQPGVPATPLTPGIWDLFPPENMVSLSVSSTSMLDSSGVTVGRVDTPAQPPNGVLAVGGPYSIQGENPISGQVNVSLEYQSEYFCGLQPNSTRVYRYNGTGWDALPTTLNEGWHLAATTITGWGIYAVFAQPNSQVVFSDVPSGSTFHDYISWITCHGIASGYADSTFRPNNNATRGQISKMVALAFQWRLEPPSAGGYTFTDAPPGSTFFLYVEAAYREGVASGYPCGGSGEPCDPNSRPYFRPGNNVTRGQIAKIISNASLYSDAPAGQTFEDVLPGSTFYTYTERIASKGIISGYPCGGAGEPCGQGNKSYFRPNNNATRGQLSKIIYLTLQPR